MDLSLCHTHHQLQFFAMFGHVVDMKIPLLNSAPKKADQT